MRLAEQLRAAGYVTASVVASPFAGRLTGLQRGFDYMSEWAVVQQRPTDAEGRATDSAAQGIAWQMSRRYLLFSPHG